MKFYYNDIMASSGETLYTGITSDIVNRVYTHKQRIIPSFTQKYNVTGLVYFERSRNVHYSIAREKEIKGWKRSKKISIIQSMNPARKDLAADWFESEEIPDRDH